MIVIKPPSPIDLPTDAASVFLAGSIDMGAAVDWQADITARFAEIVFSKIGRSSTRCPRRRANFGVFNALR